jgi:hypothetical protein
MRKKKKIHMVSQQIEHQQLSLSSLRGIKFSNETLLNRHPRQLSSSVPQPSHFAIGSDLFLVIAAAVVGDFEDFVTEVFRLTLSREPTIPSRLVTMIGCVPRSLALVSGAL